jgi:hypothetical protein
MNERIKELMTQAGMLYRLDSKPTNIDGNGTHTFQEINVYKNFDPEKFAELIIKKCSNVVLSVPCYYKDYRSQIEEAVINDCGQTVLDHFGVEK